MILEPGWRADDFTRVRDDSVNYIKVQLRQATTRNSARKCCTTRFIAARLTGT